MSSKNTNNYKPSEIEAKWQKKWGQTGIYEPNLDTAKKPFFNLMMFPYPSAEGLHVGNMYAFTGADVYGRYIRMNGFDVLKPIGLDGFGIHSENYALKVNSHPMKQAQKSEENFYRQLHAIGNGFSWNEKLETYDPDYYRWTQWIFVQLFKAGLAYRAEAEVNWCPSCKTVLADEQVIDGKCERCSSEVEKKMLAQWFFRITSYAEQLLKGLNEIDWTEKVKTAQRNWIGKSEGARLQFPLAKKYHFILLHGFGGGSDKDFFPWLKRELEAKGHSVESLDLPNTDHPKEEEQVNYVLKHGKFDEHTILFGHSLGSVVAMKVLQRLDQPIAGVVLSGSFIKAEFKDHTREFEHTFTWEFDQEKIRKMIGFARVIHDLTDTAIFEESSRSVAKLLGAELSLVEAEEEHFCGEAEPTILQNIIPSLEVFTTRPDTLHGATFMVVSPEHPFVASLLNSKLKTQNSKVEEISAYVEQAKKKTKDERTQDKEKTGVFSGAYALNPINNEQLPIWIADYVIMGYGTGAIMAVPAHDQRDFEFAKKYDLPIRQVIAPETGIPRSDEVRAQGGCGVVFDPKAQKYAVATHPDGLVRLFAGNVGEEEDLEQGILREIREESGLHDFEKVERIFSVVAHFHNSRKNVNRVGPATCLLVILNTTKLIETKREEHEKAFELSWMTPEEILANWNEHNKDHSLDHWIMFLRQAVGRAIELGVDKTSDPDTYKTEAYIGPGILINSGEWNDWKMPQEISKVIKNLSEREIGEKETTYHLRDWLISRQRYWGAPIPMIYCEACAQKGDSWFSTFGAKDEEVSRIRYKVLGKNEKDSPNTKYEIPDTNMAGWYPEENLPVELPYIDDYKPLGTGKSPLGNHPEFYEVACPECGGAARRETDVSDTFLDSSWYFFRYTSVDDATCPWDPERVKTWMPVSQYIGGAEHSVLHLLYSRFLTKVFKDLKLVSHFDEPFPKFFAHGLIIKDGAKMSKSKGNVVVPDAYIKKFGADTLRTYLMFLGPFSEGGDFRDTGIEGMYRFLKRVWVMGTGKNITSTPLSQSANSTYHKTVKGVTGDLKSFRYNTAIAKIMTLYNVFSAEKELNKDAFKVFLQLLAPFAPHMTEELWEIYGGAYSIHTSTWPNYDEKALVEENVTIVIQVNGKMRGDLIVSKDIIDDQSEIEKQAKESEALKRHLEGKEVKKVIYIPGKILNFVV